jgi:hypothetical protein
MRASLRRRLSALVGIDVTKAPDHYIVKFSCRRRAVVELSGLIAASVLLVAVSGLFLRSVAAFPYYGAVANVEQAALFYTSAGNFLNYGFGRSLFLPDYSNSSDPRDHPYVYNHMPPGPDLFLATMLKATNGSFRTVRVVLWLVFLAGIICYLSFARTILHQFGVAGVGLTLLFFSPLTLLRTMDDAMYATFPLFAFLPLVLLHRSYTTARAGYVALAGLSAFISAMYLDYLSLAVVVYSWALLWLLRVNRLESRHLVLLIVAVGGGVAAHLGQNLWYLGREVFVEELWMTLANRILGVPSKDEMKAFYQSLGLVHHGSTRVDPGALFGNIVSALEFPGGKVLAVLTVLTTAWWAGRGVRWDAAARILIVNWAGAFPYVRLFARLLLWIFGTIVLAMLTFPAFTQEYGVHGTGINMYYLALGACTIFLAALHEVMRRIPRTLSVVRDVDWQAAAMLVAMAVFAVLTVVKVHDVGKGQMRQARVETKKLQYSRLADIGEFAHSVYMTNINPVTVGFFVGEVGHGVCELNSVPVSGDIDVNGCRVFYARDRARYQDIRPRYFFFFRQHLFPGFSECLPSAVYPRAGRGGDTCVETLGDRLSERFTLVHIGPLFEVYDLHRPLPQ